MAISNSFDKCGLYIHTLAFVIGLAVSILGGLIGLGGAEFRLPLLVGIFKFQAINAIILNKVVSFCVVVFSFIFRMKTISYTMILNNIHVVFSIVPGSLIGAYYGAKKAIRLSEEVLRKIILILLIFLSIVMMLGHRVLHVNILIFQNKTIIIITSLLAGFVIGVIASTLGVAGGEIIIPTIIILYNIDIKIAGSLSLAISIPTMIVGLNQYIKSSQAVVIKQNISFVLIMILGSLVGSYLGAKLLIYVKSEYISLILGIIYLFSAIKVFKGHKK